MDGRRESEDISDSRDLRFIYIFLTYLYSYSITTLLHSVVSKHLIVCSMFDCCNVSGSVVMATRNHSKNGA